MFDIEHFKRFNDRWGHDAGDEVLIRVAQTVSARLRRTDHVGRWSGEEFMALAASTAIQGAVRLAERLHCDGQLWRGRAQKGRAAPRSGQAR